MGCAQAGVGSRKLRANALVERQPPAVGVRAGLPAAQREAREGEHDVGGDVALHPDAARTYRDLTGMRAPLIAVELRASACRGRSSEVQWRFLRTGPRGSNASPARLIASAALSLMGCSSDAGILDGADAGGLGGIGGVDAGGGQRALAAGAGVLAAPGAQEAPPRCRPAARVSGPAGRAARSRSGVHDGGGATTDRWCAFFVAPSAAALDGALFVVNVSKAAAGVSITCGGKDANCLKLTDTLAQDRIHPSLFQGDNLLSTTDPGRRRSGGVQA